MNYEIFKEPMGTLNKEEFSFCLKKLKRFLKDKGYYGYVKNYMGPVTYTTLFRNVSRDVNMYNASDKPFKDCLGLSAFVGHKFFKDSSSWMIKMRDIYHEWGNEVERLILCEKTKENDIQG